ncbi:MAG: hypothetical protein EOO83_00935 [Oxalobacteraceae bacterium]|nr:MAG: hypothetical protein EOO83_00935 [Oxalobacteraceae bacterium]
MADDMEVPMGLYTSIPENADPYTKLYMRAQVVIQGAFYSLGDRDVSPGEATLERQELEEVLMAALAMLVSADSELKTKRDIRLRADEHAKYIRQFAEGLRDGNDDQIVDMLKLLHLRASTPN